MGGRGTGLLAVFVVVAFGLVAYAVLFRPDRPEVVVLETKGRVVRTPARGEATAAAPGTVLTVRDQLAAEAEGFAILAVGSSTRLVLEGTMTITGIDAQGVRVELDDGRISARVPAGGTPLTVGRGDRAIAATDAAFVVGARDDVIQVDVERGSVALQGFGDDTDANAAERVVATAAGVAVPASLLLDVAWPEDATRDGQATVAGRTLPRATVTVHSSGAPSVVLAGPDGTFVAPITLGEGANAIRVEAVDLIGATYQTKGTVVRDSTPPEAHRAEVVYGAP